MKYKFFLLAVFTFLASFQTTLQAELHGKFDIGPVYADLDLIVNGDRNAANIHMTGIGANGTVIHDSGLTLKPSFIVANGHGTYYATGLAFGFYIPVNDKLSILPSTGMSYTHMRTHQDLIVPSTGTLLGNYNRKMSARGETVGVDITYKFTQKWMLTGVAQYAWSQSTTSFAPTVSPAVDIKTAKGESRGMNYTMMIDYFFRKNLSVQIAGTIQSSRAHIDQGMDAKGIRLALGYVF